MDSTERAAEGGILVTTEYVRHRNVLLARGHFPPLYLEYYLHLADNRIPVAPEHDRLFKDMLAAFVLHAASRPRPEMIAWTVSVQQPPPNLFVAGVVVGGGE